MSTMFNEAQGTMKKEQFKRVWLPLSDNFYRAAFSILGEEADAKDAVQDLFIKLWNSRENIDRVEQPLAYGLAALRNICIDRLRKRSGRLAKEVDISHVHEEKSQSMSEGGDRILIRKETLSMLEKALGKLPEKQRAVMKLRFYEQLSYDEIAARTGMSALNARVLVSRARSTISREMKPFL